MLPPEGIITLTVAIVLGLLAGAISTRCKTFFGILGVYLIAFLGALALGVITEVHAAGKAFGYTFGDNLIHHLVTSIIAVTIAYILSFWVIGFFTRDALGGSNVEARNRLYVPHILGVLNLIVPLGCIAQIIYWGVNRNNQRAADEVKRALQFQATFAALFLVGTELADKLEGGFGVALSILLLFAFLGWLSQTLVAIFKAKRNGEYRYRFSLRFLIKN